MTIMHMETVRDQTDLIKRTVAKGATDLELELFIRICERTGLDPFSRQIYAIKRWDAQAKAEVMQTQVSIDGLRTLAANTGEMAGQEGPFWCGQDGIWRDVWLGQSYPRAAKVVVLRTSASGPAAYTGVALYESYCQTRKDGTPTRMWEQMAPEMLAKCAEALALRKAFPQGLSGLYTTDEMGQATNLPATSRESPLGSPVSASGAPDGESITLDPPRPAEGHTGPSNETQAGMRSRVAQALGRLEPSQRSQALTLADAQRLPLPDEAGSVFPPETANKWLQIIRDCTDAS